MNSQSSTHSGSLNLIKKNFNFWVKKNWYYHHWLSQFYAFVVPSGNRVLQVGCKTGYVLNAIEPSYGVGIDDDAESIRLAQNNYKHLIFLQTSLQSLNAEAPFDYIILSSTTMEAHDIQELFASLKRFCHSGTKIIIDSYASLWEPILWLTQKLGLRRKTNLTNWLSMQDLHNFLSLTNFEVVTQGKQLLIPCYIPLISWIVNGFIAPLPIINRLCLNQWLIARPTPTPAQANQFSVSIIIPCRNEQGNIEAAIKRTPLMGAHTEFIFVEGNSQDNTVAELYRVQKHYTTHDIKILMQDGKGKGDAVRKGFAHSHGDILMILDSDLTTPPEQMPKFFNALIEGKGEFINGSRLVYGMEDQAMRFLNLLANHGFARIFSWLLGQPIKDTLCGTKVLFAKDYEKIARHRHIFGNFDPFGDFDLIFGAAKQNLKIIDMPIHYKNRTYGTSQISRFRSGIFLAYMSWIGFKKFKLHTK